MIPLDRFLADCLHEVRAAQEGAAQEGASAGGAVPVPPGADGQRDARRRFLAAGLAALRTDHAGAGWTQLNLAPPDPAAYPALYARLGEIARESLSSGAAVNFFFMHKPPGMRVRFQAPTPGASDELHRRVIRRMAEHPEIFGNPRRAVYEPESYLFGGPAALPWVHSLFTADSLAWLDHHAARPLTAPADWRHSLTLLRELLDGLGIVGWEHRGVWGTLREEAGRALGGEAARERGVDRAIDGIQRLWRLDRDRLTAGLPEPRRTALDAHRAAVHRAALDWREGYFDAGGGSGEESGDASGDDFDLDLGVDAGAVSTGPRRAAAYCVVFHWNRARFSAALQRLLTEALATEGTPIEPSPRVDRPVVGVSGHDR
ncbi:thiopeptide-type bacteriocin biosynthesis protein [Streptomyces sp. NPDC004610]|uniref:thiopeptide-type bacteriocin biosynthesis protein n=1 Tax=unclassified Streptomyces TaxID=2593676 RepID=UPI0033A20F67